MKVRLWIDVRCPWTWMAARWLVEDVEPKREIEISWETMSLYLRKEITPDSPAYKRMWFTHRLLRILQALKASGPEHNAGLAYFEFATRV